MLILVLELIRICWKLLVQLIKRKVCDSMEINLPNWIYLLIGGVFIGVVVIASILSYVIFLNSAEKLIDKNNKKKPN